MHGVEAAQRDVALPARLTGQIDRDLDAVSRVGATRRARQHPRLLGGGVARAEGEHVVGRDADLRIVRTVAARLAVPEVEEELDAVLLPRVAPRQIDHGVGHVEQGVQRVALPERAHLGARALRGSLDRATGRRDRRVGVGGIHLPVHRRRRELGHLQERQRLEEGESPGRSRGVPRPHDMVVVHEAHVEVGALSGLDAGVRHVGEREGHAVNDLLRAGERSLDTRGVEVLLAAVGEGHTVGRRRRPHDHREVVGVPACLPTARVRRQRVEGEVAPFRCVGEVGTGFDVALEHVRGRDERRKPRAVVDRAVVRGLGLQPAREQQRLLLGAPRPGVRETPHRRGEDLLRGRCRRLVLPQQVEHVAVEVPLPHPVGVVRGGDRDVELGDRLQEAEALETLECAAQRADGRVDRGVELVAHAVDRHVRVQQASHESLVLRALGVDLGVVVIDEELHRTVRAGRGVLVVERLVGVLERQADELLTENLVPPAGPQTVGGRLIGDDLVDDVPRDERVGVRAVGTVVVRDGCRDVEDVRPQPVAQRLLVGIRGRQLATRVVLEEPRGGLRVPHQDVPVQPEVFRLREIEQSGRLGVAGELPRSGVPGLDLHVVLGRDLVVVVQQQFGGGTRGLARVDRDAQGEVDRVFHGDQSGVDLRALGDRDPHLVHEERRGVAAVVTRLDVDLRGRVVGRHGELSADGGPARGRRVLDLQEVREVLRAARDGACRQGEALTDGGPRRETHGGADGVGLAGLEQPSDFALDAVTLVTALPDLCGRHRVIRTALDDRHLRVRGLRPCAGRPAVEVAGIEVRVDQDGTGLWIAAAGLLVRRSHRERERPAVGQALGHDRAYRRERAAAVAAAVVHENHLPRRDRRTEVRRERGDVLRLPVVDRVDHRERLHPE
ncbi:hypothetical protein SRABI128_02797 [Microbacterium sp. Bi128]|nr:hypothetical protein SRABI128_02797 [Microbacterium sp. Bi128]